MAGPEWQAGGRRAGSAKVAHRLRPGGAKAVYMRVMGPFQARCFDGRKNLRGKYGWKIVRRPWLEKVSFFVGLQLIIII